MVLVGNVDHPALDCLERFMPGENKSEWMKGKMIDSGIEEKLKLFYTGIVERSALLSALARPY